MDVVGFYGNANSVSGHGGRQKDASAQQAALPEMLNRYRLLGSEGQSQVCQSSAVGIP